MRPDAARRADSVVVSAAKDLIAAVVLAMTVLATPTARATEAPPAAADPALEARMVKIAAELRCLVCQNQTIADSNAALAVDLRRQARELLQQGRSDQEVVDYMTARYGDFVLYRPPLRATTALLWFGPAFMLIVGAGVLFVVLKKRSRLPDDAFDAEEAVADDGPGARLAAPAAPGRPG